MLPQCSRSEVHQLLSLRNEPRLATYQSECRPLRRDPSLASLRDKVGVKELIRRWEPSLRVARLYASVHRAEDITAELLAGFPPNFIVKAAHGGQMTMAVGDGGRTATCHGFCGKGGRIPKNLPRWAAPAEAGPRARRGSLSAFLRKYCAHWLGFNYSRCAPTAKRGCLHIGIKGSLRGRPCS